MEADRKIMNSDFGVKEPATKEKQHPEKAFQIGLPNSWGNIETPFAAVKDQVMKSLIMDKVWDISAAAVSTSVCRPHETVPSY
ncbi:hypothetical protein CEXT_420441 [Caerostris extrusa]|uniref:Uncharacterized protein n=1 Tax=Caerostris extrusa TaxID=172846 RepID=A0AAV4PQ76_CAEEX|nr:hypothetical protein CEXT_420441 [Caerostris extrusa]